MWWYHNRSVIVFLKIYFLIIHVNCIKAYHLDDEEQTTNCISNNLIKRYNLNEQIYRNCDNSDKNGIVNNTTIENRYKRRINPIFKGKPKARAEVLSTKFHLDLLNFEQTNSLVQLVNKIAVEYLAKCPPVIYYDSFVEKSDGMILENLFKTFPITFYHGETNERFEAINNNFQNSADVNCKSYILFLSDPLVTRKILGPQVENRVLLIARSSQWKLRDFLASETSSNIVNLLVIGESLTMDPLMERSYVLYTHKLYTDGLGSNTPIVLTSWIRGALSRPHINLFPPKFLKGFAGHRFQVAAANQPPFIFRIKTMDSSGAINTRWEGIEYRLMNMIAKRLNFSIDIVEPARKPNSRSIIDDIQFQIAKQYSDIGMAGVYVTEERLHDIDMSVGHSKDCATFITLASKALPKYRAIMGPFQWPVWLCIVIVYLGAIFPIVYSDRLTLAHLIGNWSEIENMFWYVFGMFTNSLTFSGKYSWYSSRKASTRILIGSYWLFTIIITACYTGSIIAFVTLPSFPKTADSVTDLLGLFFRVGTLDNSGWETWFQNSTHIPTEKLYKKMEFVSTLDEGIGNVTQSFFWNYAFLGSKSQLEYMVQANFTDENLSRRSALHLSDECFALFQIGFMFPRDAVYKRQINSILLMAQQSGLIDKIVNEVKWDMQRSSTGKLLQASSMPILREVMQEERQLTTADIEGMFLLMGIGYLLGAIALISEIVGGITNKCRQILKRSRKSFSSNWSSRRNSVDEGIQRTDTEQKAHDKHKDDRRKQAEIDDNKNYGFGAREFNITKSTLKELYGNYYKSEPNYVLKGGKLLLETEAISTGSTEEGNSRVSSSGLPIMKKFNLPRLRSKLKTMVVAKVDVENTSGVSDDHDVNDSLDILDRCLQGHHAASSNTSEGEEHEGASFKKDPALLKCFDEQEIFGSLIQGEEKALTRVERLNLCYGEEQLDEKEVKENGETPK